MVKSITTEQRIFEAARNVFLKKGLSGARMQEIADEAGINKALLHYYFRTKDKLFYAIFQDTFKNMLPSIANMFGSPMPLESKIRQLTEKYFEVLNKNRYLPIFILSEIQHNPERIARIINISKYVDFGKLTYQIGEEYGIKNIDVNLTRHIFVNFISNVIFPFVGRPIIQFIFKMSEEEYHAFLEERKKLIPAIFIQTIKSLSDHADNKS
jgi:AcrR family transcriptional regulator